MTERRLERTQAETRALRDLVSRPVDAAAWPAAPVHRLHVLVAEDNDLIAMLNQRLLERDGHVVWRVTNGRDAVEAMRGAMFDLVLMDVQMPELDGIDATRQIRAEEAASGRERCAIWALTAAADDELARCVEAGADAAFAKPFGFQQMRERLAPLLARYTPVPQRTTG